MARYNTVNPLGSLSLSGAAATSPNDGQFTTITGASGNTITLAAPATVRGVSQTFYNTTGGAITVSGNGGNIVGPGFASAGTQSIANNAVFTVVSDGTNYVIFNEEGGPLAATGATISGNLNVTTGGITVGAGGASISGNSSVTGTLNVTSDFSVATNKLTVASSTGNTVVAGTLGVTSDLAVATNKFTVASATGNTSVAGTLGVTGDFNVATNKFSVTASNGNFASPGTMSLSATAVTHVISSTAASSTVGSGALTIAGGLGVAGQITTATLVETSSIAFKENVNPITGALDAILQLVGKTYDRIDTKKHEAGLIAEEVYKVLPGIVALDENGKPYGVQYTKLTAYLVESIKSLKEEIDQLKGTR